MVTVSGSDIAGNNQYIYSTEETEQKPTVTLNHFVEYEIVSAPWWALLISGLFQDTASKYYVWKAQRKYKRYLAFKKLVK